MLAKYLQIYVKGISFLAGLIKIVHTPVLKFLPVRNVLNGMLIALFDSFKRVLEGIVAHTSLSLQALTNEEKIIADSLFFQL